LKITIVTLFPDLIEAFFKTSIISKLDLKGLIETKTINFRDYGFGSRKKIDDYAYGGGSGMVLMIEPLYNVIKDLRFENPNVKIYLMSPQGKKFDQRMASELSQDVDLAFICGHYEGFDARVLDYVDGEISIGDFVMTGGEVAAMAIVEATVRLVPGALKLDSVTYESFFDNLLDHDVYSVPRIFDGKEVPEILFSGHHEKIHNFRYQNRLLKTKSKRPDLYLAHKRKNEI
jgi:tRNA (guanine37-N1)-methyltransferase